MKKINKSKKVVIILLLFFIFIFTGYIAVRYANNEKSNLTVNNKAMYEVYFTLLENRAAITEFTKLDPAASSFLEDKNNIITRLQESNNKAQSLLSTALGVNEELSKKTLKTLDDQEKIIAKLQENSQKFEILYKVKIPDRVDILQKELLIENSSTARIKIEEIRVNQEGESDELANQLQTIIEDLNKLETDLANNDTNSAQLRLANLEKNIIVVKSAALNLERSILLTEESVKMLTSLTNSILEYKFLLDT